MFAEEEERLAIHKMLLHAIQARAALMTVTRNPTTNNRRMLAEEEKGSRCTTNCFMTFPTSRPESRPMRCPEAVLPSWPESRPTGQLFRTPLRWGGLSLRISGNWVWLRVHPA